MKAMITMIIDCERKESEFIWTGGLSTGRCQEPNAISCVHLKCRMLAIMMCDTGSPRPKRAQLGSAHSLELGLCITKRGMQV